ncbi:4'-phosphopantetheinyl transferase family protein [Yunchengibacter salinarum]|uniref:4'-phosphopantetheinyl transferase family protein n=1 Tax=Yunchengibacter salinarum TaxID=3133399 RepID=UPI0035B58294
MDSIPFTLPAPHGGTGTIAVIAPGGELDGACLAALSVAEQARANAATPAFRLAFVTGRGLLRMALSRWFHQQTGHLPAPSRIPLYQAPGGPPLVDQDRLPAALRGGAFPFFSVSHTITTGADGLPYGLAVVLVSDSGPVGIDLELADRPVIWRRLAERRFAPAEAAWLREAPDRAARRFLHLWTIKEAAAKALGLGLGRALRTVTPALPLPTPGTLETPVSLDFPPEAASVTAGCDLFTARLDGACGLPDAWLALALADTSR